MLAIRLNLRCTKLWRETNIITLLVSHKNVKRLSLRYETYILVCVFFLKILPYPGSDLSLEVL